MDSVYSLQFFRKIINLEEQPIFAPYKNPFQPVRLDGRRRVLLCELEIQNCENCISSVVVEHHGLPRKMLVLNPPKSYVFFSARNQFVVFDRRKLYTQYVEITNLFRDQNRLLFLWYVPYIPYYYHLSLLCVHTHCA